MLENLLQGSTIPIRPLPQGAGMRVAIRQTLRIGPQAGNVVEDVGVSPETTHHITRADLLNDNVDLIGKAAEMLSQMPVYALDLEAQDLVGNAVTLAVRTANLDRVDFYLNTRPNRSLDVTSADLVVNLEGVRAGDVVLARGFASGRCAAARKLTL